MVNLGKLDGDGVTEEDIQGVPKVYWNTLIYYVSKVIPQPNLQYYNILKDFKGMEMFQLPFKKVRKDKL